MFENHSIETQNSVKAMKVMTDIDLTQKYISFFRFRQSMHSMGNQSRVFLTQQNTRLIVWESFYLIKVEQERKKKYYR